MFVEKEIVVCFHNGGFRISRALLEKWKEIERGEEDVKGFKIKVVLRVNVVVEDESAEEDEDEDEEEDQEEDEEPVQEVVVDDLVEWLLERCIEGLW